MIFEAFGEQQQCENFAKTLKLLLTFVSFWYGKIKFKKFQVLNRKVDLPRIPKQFLKLIFDEN